MVRILIADDQKTTREILKSYFEPESDLEVVGVAVDGKEALEKIETLHPDIALLDIEMPKIDGLTATRIISQRFPQTKVLILSSHDGDEYLSRALQVGANGYLLKTTSGAEIVSSIRSVFQGYFQLGPGLLEKVLYKVSESMVTADDVAQLRQLLEARDPDSEKVPADRVKETFYTSQESIDKNIEVEKLLTENARLSEELRNQRAKLNSLALRSNKIERKVNENRNLITFAIAAIVLAVFVVLFLFPFGGDGLVTKQFAIRN